MLYVYETCWNGVCEDIGCDTSMYGEKRQWLKTQLNNRLVLGC